MGKAKRQRKAELRASKLKSQPLSLYEQILQNRGWLFLVIFVLAFSIRMIYLVEDSASPFYEVKGTDAKIYDIRAKGLLSGVWPGNAAFELRPPGYPFFMASVYTLFGKSPAAVKFVQLLLGAISCIFIFLIAEQLFGGLRVPSIAALLYALNGVIIFYDSQLLSGSLDAFLTLAVLLLFLKAGRQPTLIILLLAGLATGFSIMNRGWMLLFLPVGLLWLWFIANEQGADKNTLTQITGFQKITIKECAIIAAIALLPLSMVVWQNAKYNELPASSNKAEVSVSQTVKRIFSGQFVLLAAGNINLYIGNHKDWLTFNDASIDDAGHFVDFQNLRDEPRKLHNLTSVSDKNAYFSRKTVETIFQDPVLWLQLMIRKAGQYFNGNEIPRAVTIYAYREYSYLLSALVWKKGIAFPSGVLIPLGLIGLFLARKQWKQHFPAMSMLLIHVGFLLLFFVTARYRLPAIPLLTIYAAFSIVTFIDLFKAKHYKKMLLILAFLMLVGVMANFKVGPMAGHSSHEYNSLGVTLYRQGKIEASIEQYQKALSVDIKHAESHRNLGLAYNDQNHIKDAIYHGQQAIVLDPAYVDAYNDLAYIYLMQNRLDESINMYKRVIELAPKKKDTYLNIAVVYYKQKKYGPASEYARKAVSLNPTDSQAHYNLARILLTMGDHKEAVSSLQRVLQLEPSNHRAQGLLQKIKQSHQSAN